MIVIGIDPHKQTHTAVAVDGATGKVLADLTIKARTPGFERLLEWARALDDERLFAVEDGRHVSGHLERHLIGRGERSVRVPPRMMGEARRTDRISGKSDPVDATAVARAALRHSDLPEATLAGPERQIGLLVAHREMLINERTDRICKLRWLLHDIDPDLARPCEPWVGSRPWTVSSERSRPSSPPSRSRSAWICSLGAGRSPGGRTSSSARSVLS